MTEEPTTYEVYNNAELLASLVLVAFMLAAKEPMVFAGKNYIVNAARLIIRAKAYILENSPEEVNKFYQDLQFVLNGVIR